MTTFLENPESEIEELGEKLDNLDSFITSNAFYELGQYQKSLLMVQYDALRTYLRCLSLQSGDLKFSSLTFGEATEFAKQGKKIARSGWNGQGMFAYIVPAASYPAQTEAAKNQFGEMVPYRAYWALKTAQNDVATWAPSGSDSLAEDWMVVE